MRERLIGLQRFVEHSLRNADGLRYPYNLKKIHAMIKDILKDFDTDFCERSKTMDTPKQGFEEGVRAARYMGAEFQANPGSSRREYLDSAAWYFGYDTYAEMPDKERKACSASFNAGAEAERNLQ